MARHRAFQNPYSKPVKGMNPLKGMQPLQRELNSLRATVMDIPAAVEQSLNPKNGRAWYNIGRNGCVWQCIQMVDFLSWWRWLLVPLIGKYCEIDGVKYLMAGKTNTFHYANRWVKGGKKSLLRMI